MKHILLAFALALAAAAAVPAELALLVSAAAPANNARSKPLTLHVAPPPSRALQYALLPELRDTIPGNAVDHYRQAIKNMKQDAPPSKDWDPALEQWMAAPLKDFPRDDVAKFLKPCESTFKEVDAGAHSEQCDWGLTEELRKNGLKGLDAILPNVSDMARSRPCSPCASVMSCAGTNRPSRSCPANRIRHGATPCRGPHLHFRTGRHSHQQPDVGSTGRIDSAAGRAELLLAAHGPAATHHRPARPLQGESVCLIPGVNERVSDLNAMPWTPEQVDAVVAVFRQMDKNNAILGPVLGGKPEEEEKLLHLAAQQEGIKKILIDEGRPKEVVDAMPDIQAALLVGYGIMTRRSTNS